MARLTNPNEEVQFLRTEVIESQKARIDLLKYKLLAIATLGSIGLGFSAYQEGNLLIDSDYIICIIPFVCIYVDLLCWHNTLRILVIGRFLDYRDNAYENYLSNLGKDTPRKSAGYFYELEDFALHWSTLFVSVLIFFYGVYYLTTTHDNHKGSIFLITGLVWIILPIVMKRSYDKHIKVLFDLASNTLRTISIVNNEHLSEFIKPKYTTLHDIHRIELFLENKGTFCFPALENGLFSAALLGKEREYTGYTNIWVRDNIHIPESVT